MKITRALLSVSDKTGLLPFAQRLTALGIELLSTGGTAKFLRENGVPVVEISAYTGFPEILSGRVKTLHPTVHGGLLFRRGDAEHEEQAVRSGIQPIDLLVVNLYPFEQTVARPETTLPEAIEQIDIGGPAMLRSAAKNYRSVTVVTDPADYDPVLAELAQHEGGTTEETRARLAWKVFATTAKYDGAIANYLGAKPDAGAALSHPALRPARQVPLRYGENPHQQAALVGDDFASFFSQLHGKELSYNNILDLSAAAELIGEFSEPACAILKHNNPCGVGTDDASLLAAWDKALATDRQAPFGGIIAVNRPLDEALAAAIAEIFSEVIIAPEFTAGALAVLQKKKNLRLLRQLRPTSADSALEARSVVGGLLVQSRDRQLTAVEKTVSKRPPTDAELKALRFGWHVVKHVKSNAIVFCGSDRTLGVGAGQMARVDSVNLAIWKAGQSGLSLQGSVVASDAFFPFPDGLVAAVKAGATAAIQPGGSMRDAEVIAAADENGAAMIFTGLRHFRH
jgi:phosphoribosylaminoimidazolecarboxamide formyltransferase / IMP cyclohydrolase